MIKKLYLSLTLLTALLCFGSGTAWGDELTVASGTDTKEEVPVYGWNGDTKDTKSQTLYLSSDLSSMAGKEITALKFYSSTANASWGVAVFDVKLAHVADADMSSSPLSPSFTTVYSGTISVVSNEMSIAFDEPFTYNGTDNLLLEIHISTKGDYAHAYFYGVTTEEYMGVMSYPGWSGTQTTKVWFTPKTTFTYAAATSSCAKPTELGYSNVTATSVDLDWTNGGTESSWNVLYKASSDADWSTTVASEHPFTLSGLTPNTNYQVKVQAVCGENDESGFSNVVSFPTPCASITLPWALDLSSATNNTILECWDISGSTSTTKSGSSSYNIWGVYSAGGTKMLRMNNYSVQAGTALINTPNIVVPNDGKNYELAFDYENSAYKSTTNLSFSVKVSKDGGSTFSELDTYAKNSSVAYDGTPADFEEATISLADYAGETIILQFFANANYGYGAMFVKNIRIIAASSCTKPTALSYANVTTNSVDLSWTAGASETAWNVRYMADGDADWTVIPANSNTNFTVSSLSNNTHYTMQVQADCGSDVVSEWNTTAIDFTTNAVAPWSENFEAQTINQVARGWDNSASTATTAAQSDKPAIWNVYQYPAVTGNKMIRMFNYYANNGIALINTPSIAIPASPAYELTFDYAHNASCGAFYVKVSTDGGANFSEGTSYTKGSGSDKDNPGEFTKATIDLSSYAGQTIILQFYANANYGNGSIFVDNLDIHERPSCITPTGLGYSAVTAEGATLSWIAGGSETAWKVQYSEDNSTWSEAVDATSNPFVLTGLNDNTLYYVRVAANCGESVSDYTSAIVSFTTKCAAITSFPWSEDFQGETNETNIVCWDNSASTCFSNPAGATPSKYVWGVIRTGSYGDYNYQLYMRNFNVRAGTALINTPSFTLPSDKDMQLVFNYSHLASCDPLVVKVSVNGGEFSAIDGASYSNDPAGSYNYSSPGTYKEATIDLSAYRGKTITLQFFTTANYGEGAIWLDNVRIEAAPTCFKPQNLSAASSITPDGATFSWSASGHGESTYQWAVAAGSDAPVWVDDDAHKTTELSKTVSGLASGTYKFYVRSYCSSVDQSEAAVSASFTTATVAAPTIGTITTTNTTAHATWTAPSVSFPVQYQWSTNGSSWSAATSNLYADLTSLSASTSYTFYVRSYYDASHIGSAATKAFKTACDPFTVAVGTPFEQNFNDVTTNAIPDCWNNDEGTTTTASYKWKVVTGGQSGKCAMFNGTDNGLGKTNVFATPLLVINSDADLSFYWKNKKTGAYSVEISVDGASRTTLVSGLTGIDAWTLVDMPLTSYNGHSIQLFFCGTSANDGSANLYLDEFKITPISCRKPASDPVVSSKDDTHATITWTAGGDNTDYQFALALKDEAPVWDENNVVTALITSFDNLTPLTWYDFYVRTYCDESNQSDARKVTFRTDCAGFVTLPFNENFNGLADVTTPECWDNSEGSITDEYKKWRSRNSNYLCFNSSTTDADETSILATPTIQLGEGNLLTFKTKNPTGGAFKVQIKEEGEDAVDLITGLTGLADWTLKYAAIPAAYNNKKVQILFHATSNGGDANAYIYIDDVRVARGEFFDDAANSGVKERVDALDGQTIDFVMNRPMQFNGAYNTLCLPFDINAEDMADSDHPLYNNTVKVFDYATIGENELLLAIKSASSIEAGVPCFVKYDGLAGDARSAFLFKEVTIKAGLTPTVDGDASYKGIYEPIAVTAETDNGPHHIIFVGADNQLYWPGANRTMRGFRAYFHIDANSLNENPIKPGMPARLVEHHNTPTAVENINVENGAVIKRLENNQVVIIRNGVKYNIQGQVISK